MVEQITATSPLALAATLRPLRDTDLSAVGPAYQDAEKVENREARSGGVAGLRQYSVHTVGVHGA